MKNFIFKNRIAIKLGASILALLLLLMGWLTDFKAFYITAFIVSTVAFFVDVVVADNAVYVLTLALIMGVAVVFAVVIAATPTLICTIAGVSVIAVTVAVNLLLLYLENEDRKTVINGLYVFKNGIHNRQLKTQQNLKSIWKAITFSGEEYDGVWGDLVQLYQILKEEGVPFGERIVEVTINAISIILQLMKDKITMAFRSQTHRNE